VNAAGNSAPVMPILAPPDLYWFSSTVTDGYACEPCGPLSFLYGSTVLAARLYLNVKPAGSIMMLVMPFF